MKDRDIKDIVSKTYSNQRIPVPPGNEIWNQVQSGTATAKTFYKWYVVGSLIIGAVVVVSLIFYKGGPNPKTSILAEGIIEKDSSTGSEKAFVSGENSQDSSNFQNPTENENKSKATGKFGDMSSYEASPDFKDEYKNAGNNPGVAGSSSINGTENKNPIKAVGNNKHTGTRAFAHQESSTSKLSDQSNLVDSTQNEIALFGYPRSIKLTILQVDGTAIVPLTLALDEKHTRNLTNQDSSSDPIRSKKYDLGLFAGLNPDFVNRRPTHFGSNKYKLNTPLGIGRSYQLLENRDIGVQLSTTLGKDKKVALSLGWYTMANYINRGLQTNITESSIPGITTTELDTLYSFDYGSKGISTGLSFSTKLGKKVTGFAGGIMNIQMYNYSLDRAVKRTVREDLNGTFSTSDSDSEIFTEEGTYRRIVSPNVFSVRTQVGASYQHGRFSSKVGLGLAFMPSSKQFRSQVTLGLSYHLLSFTR